MHTPPRLSNAPAPLLLVANARRSPAPAHLPDALASPQSSISLRIKKGAFFWAIAKSNEWLFCTRRVMSRHSPVRPAALEMTGLRTKWVQGAGLTYNTVVNCACRLALTSPQGLWCCPGPPAREQSEPNRRVGEPLTQCRHPEQL